MSPPVTMIQTIRWGAQCADDAVQWAVSANNITDESRLTDFRAGHETGWRDAVSTLKLHGIDIPTT